MRAFVLVTVLALLPSVVLGEVGPFGVLVGKSTIQEVQTEVGSRSVLEDAGVNKWTQGKMLRAKGSGLGIEGLQGVLFIFDRSGRLVGVLLDLPKHRYEAIAAALKGNYPIVREVNPFVGDRSVTMRKGAVEIEANSPHLSFEMSVVYMHDDLAQAMKSGQIKQEQEQTDRERSAL